MEKAPAIDWAARIQVKHRDVMQFKKQGCKSCRGTGELIRTTLRTPRQGDAKAVYDRKAILCSCAMRRFLKKQPVDANRETGALYFAEPISHATIETLEEDRRAREVSSGVSGGGALDASPPG